MLWPPVYTFVVQRPVVCLDDRRPLKNRKQRRRSHYGRASVWDKLAGRMSPKEMREAGL